MLPPNVLVFSLAAFLFGVTSGAHIASGHSVKIRTQYKASKAIYPNFFPEVASAAQYVQYASDSGGSYKGSPYGNPRYQGSYDTSKRFYGLVSVSLPIMTIIGILTFLPTVTHVGSKYRRRRNVEIQIRDRDQLLRTLHIAIRKYHNRSLPGN